LAVVRPRPTGLATVFFDTSVLLKGTIDLGPSTHAAQELMNLIAAKRAPGRPHTAWHCCLEYYAVSTRLPGEARIAPSDAARLLEEEILARFDVHQLPPKGFLGFVQSAPRDRVAGGRTYDAHIAEIARTAGSGIVATDNVRHFSALETHGIEVLKPEALLARLTAVGR
jgi:toxin FitB